MIRLRRNARISRRLFAAVLIFSLPLLYGIGQAFGEDASSPERGISTVGRDVYFETEGEISGPPAPKMRYPDSYGGGDLVNNRSLLWIFIQQHFFLGSFILGVPMIAWMLELFNVFLKRGGLDRSEKFDRLGREIMQICLPFYPLTVFLGIALLGAFIFLYGEFFKYMSSVFKPVIYLYAIAFFLESLLLYAYALTWNRWRRDRYKWVHLSLGGLTCFNGLVIIYLANAWMAFMMSPAGIDTEGHYLGKIWNAVHTPLWNPLNVHRILASIMFSGAVISAYAAYKLLTTRDPAKKAHYDWMGHVMIMISILNLFILPIAGYWFAKAIFKYRNRMGVTLMGGELSWPFVMQATLIGLIFMAVTYYLWQGTARMRGSERYHHLVKYMMIILAVSFIIWTTPHAIPASEGEFRAMGGARHPIVGYFGTMAAKNTAINTMILSFGLCYIIFHRCNKRMTISWSKWGNTAMILLFAAAEVLVIYYGVYGFFVPASVRVKLALPQFNVAMSALVIGGFLNWGMLRRSESLGPIQWGKLPRSGAFSLFSLAFFITTTMVLMGYIRSSVRLDWHITEVMKDNTPWAGTPSLTYAVGMVFFNVVLFWVIAALIFRSGSARKITAFSMQQEGSANIVDPIVEPKEFPSEMIPK
ncbi:MAG: cytochrome ubiquinol oxidase subunit I [Nitrospiria bacterium]